MKYRKKPVEIEAMLWTGSASSTQEVVAWIGDKAAYRESPGGDVAYIGIETLEGTIQASIGDYIIQGVHGEFYPCKPDIFEETYELVEA